MTSLSVILRVRTRLPDQSPRGRSDQRVVVHRPLAPGTGDGHNRPTLGLPSSIGHVEHPFRDSLRASVPTSKAVMLSRPSGVPKPGSGRWASCLRSAAASLFSYRHLLSSNLPGVCPDHRIGSLYLPISEPQQKHEIPIPHELDQPYPVSP